MPANPPTKSIKKTHLFFGDFVIPIKIYKSSEEFGISGELFHDGCDGKIRSPHVCELHPDLEYPPTYSAINIGERNLKLTDTFRAQLMQSDGDFTVVSTHKLSSLSHYISSGIVVPQAFHELAPQYPADKSFATFLNRLRVKKLFCLVQGPLGNMRRYALLFSSGHLMGLLYDDEIRGRKRTEISPDPSLNKTIDSYLDSALDEITDLSLQPLVDHINALIEAAISQPVARRAKA